ncbi:MAG: CoA-binding protein [Dehalococcoidales bacterium]|nr:CoA-binding protein [Dehalococcoidales bacterium]
MDKPVNWQSIFYPGSIAVIGASNSGGSWGYNAMKGLLNEGGRRVYPVNPKSGDVLGVRSYSNVAHIPDTVDLAVIVVAAQRVPEVMRDCVSRGVKAAVVISAGFAETGEQGRKLQEEVVRIANEGGIYFVGPNSMGHANLSAQLNSFGPGWSKESGRVALLSQSGSTCFKIVRAAGNSGVAFGKCVSTGNEASLKLEDYLEYLSEDNETGVITAYIEGLRDGRRFYELAKKTTLHKPIIVVKIGGTKESARAVMSHTGALAGADEIYTAAFRQSGVIRAEDDDELCDVLGLLVNCPLPRSGKVGILSIGGGQGALTAELCEKAGLEIGQLSPDTVKKLDECLPSRWSRRNPVDMAGVSAGEHDAGIISLRVLLEDKNIDTIFLQTPIVADRTLDQRMGFTPEQSLAHQKQVEKNLRDIRQKMEEYGKPVILVGVATSVITDPEAASLLRRERIPVIPNSRRAARVIKHLSWYKQYLQNAGRV